MMTEKDIKDIVNVSYIVTYFSKDNKKVEDLSSGNGYVDILVLIKFRDVGKIYKGEFRIYSIADWNLSYFDKCAYTLDDVVIFKPEIELDNFIDKHRYITCTSISNAKKFEQDLSLIVRNNKLDKILNQN
jgi:hypothetical protein